METKEQRTALADYICPACGGHGVLREGSQAAGVNEWCEAGMAGAHLKHMEFVTCQFEHSFGPTTREVGRFCPGRCDWSREVPS